MGVELSRFPSRGVWSRRAVVCAAATAALLTRPAAATADEATAKREVPDYDGREPAPPGLGQRALLVPRLLLSPLYITSEYLVRRPLAVAIPAAERADLPLKLYDFFTFGPNHQAGILPVGFLQFGFRPSVGVYAFWKDAFLAGHDLRLHLETWTPAWLAGWWTERLRFGGRTLELRLAATRRPDLTFHGIGPRAPAWQRSRYRQDLLDGSVRIDHALWRFSHLHYGIGVRTASFAPGRHGTDPTVHDQVASGVFPEPDGLATGYTAPYLRLQGVLDSRRPWPFSGSGLRLKLLLEQSNDVRSTPIAGWLRYEVGAGAFYDLTGYQRVLSLSATAMFCDPIGPRPVPFTELVALGGDGPMRGFSGRRLMGRSAAALTSRYQWPVGPWLAGTIAVAVGNVFDQHLAGVRPDLLRLSGTVGLAAFSADHPFEILLGLGTDPFDEGGKISSVVGVLSVNRGL